MKRIEISLIVLLYFNSCIHLPLKSANVEILGFVQAKSKIQTSSKSSPDNLKIIIEDLNRKGVRARDNAQIKDALSFHFEALELSEKGKDTLQIIFSLNSIGTDLRRISSNTEASQYHYRALELANSSKKYLKNQAVAMNGLGNIFLSLNKPSEAKDYFNKALEIEIELKSDLGQAINYANIGEAWHQMNKNDKALDFYSKSLEKNQAIRSNLGISICLSSMGIINFEEGKEDVAFKQMQNAFDLLQESKDTYHRLEIRLALSNAYYNLGYFSEAQQSLHKAIEAAQTINSLDHLYRSSNLLSSVYKKQSSFKHALKYSNLATVYYDSMMIQSNESRIFELENRFKRKQAEEKIESLILEKSLIERAKRNQQYIYLLSLLLTLITLMFVINYFRNRQRINKEIQNINAIKIRFFNNISHELKTPITLINGPIKQILDNNKISNKDRQSLQIAQRNAKRLQELLEQILNLSKIDTGNFQILVSNGNLNNKIKGLANAFSFIASKKQIEFNTEVTGLRDVWFDFNIIEIILNNLLSNAFKFTPENGMIDFSAKEKNNQMYLCISNTIDKAINTKPERLFDRFYSLGNYYEGTGIGLSLVKELCILYRGKVDVQYNEKNKKIKFCVTLPIQKNNFDTSEIAPTINSGKADLSLSKNDDPLSSSKSAPILLIIEDNPDMLHYLSNSFTSFKVLTAQNGEEGLSLARETVPDIIISDIMMPKMEGIELSTILKNDELTSHIPIILLTAKSSDRDELIGLKAGVDHYIRKPFNLNTLKARVDNLIQVRKLLREKYQQEFPLQSLNVLYDDIEDKFSQRLKDIVENHISNPNFSVTDFCDLTSMSRTQLHRKIKALTGYSTSEFIRANRIKKAAELLKEPHTNITDVCYASGFNNTSYFSKCFKHFFKCSPSSYKEKISKDSLNKTT